MPATIAGSHLGPDTHANRPAANAAGQPIGAFYSCTTHGLIYKTDGATWSTYATLGGSPSGSITASGYTQATARLLGRSTASTGAIEEITVGAGLSLSAGSLSAACGGATAIQRPALTPGSFDATYGDDFAAASVDAKWNRRADSGTFSAGHVITQARDGSHLRLSADELSRFQLYQACPGSGDFEFVAGGVRLNFQTRGTDYLFGIGIVSSAGTGEAIVLHAADVYLMSVTTWGFGAQQGTVANMAGFSAGAQEWWLRITKVGTTYTGYVSMNGITWLATAGSTNAFTPAYFAIGTFFSSGPLHGYMDVDWVDKV